MSYPCVRVDMRKLRHNLETLLEIVHSQGMTAAMVTKVVCAEPRIVRLIQESDADIIADSRVKNLRSIGEGKPRMLLRVAMPSEAEEVAASSEMSLQSEPATLRLLSEAAVRQGKSHKVILMIDMGDLREGIFFRNRGEILETTRLVRDLPGLELYGTGVNLTCYGAIIPDDENLGGLVEITEWLRRELNEPIPFISGGNSSSIGLVREHKAPHGITNLRLGESLVLGNDTAKCEVMEGLHGDCFTLCAELCEVKVKPSKPIGTSGANAFGEKVVYEDIGDIRRGILAIGRQDINAENLLPRDPCVKILGASSDHLLVNLSDAPGYKVGDILEFDLDYGNLLRAFTSAYVDRVFTE